MELNVARNRYIETDVYWSPLTLDSVADRQDGLYQCVADNGVGSATVVNATLFVYDDGQGKSL